MKLNKDDIYGIAGSVAFHLFILLILGFTVLKTVVPDEDGGILVNFGNVNAAAGTFEPKYTGQEPPQETTPPPPPVPEPKVETPKEDLVTQEIEESVAIEEAKKKKEKKKVVSQPEEPKKKKNPFNISSIQENEAGKSPMFYMVTGIVIGVIVAAVLIYPTVRASFSHKNSTQVEDYKEQILAKDTQLKASEKKVKEAKAAQKKAEDELDEYIGTSKKDGVYDLLLSALQKYSDRDYTGSADALLDIDSQKLTTKNMKAIYKDLTAKVYPSAGTGLYSKGKNAYWAKDYKTAISYLKKAIKVSDTNRYAYDYLAKAYEGASDQKNAKKTYQTIIEKFPGTSQAINAKSRIDAMGKKSAKSL